MMKESNIVNKGGFMTKEHEKLLKLWMSGKATTGQISRCMVLDRALRSKGQE
jgi:hypothetical protein